MRQHWLRVVLIAVPLLLVVSVLGYLLVNPAAITREVEAKVIPALSAKLGRKVQVGELHLRLFPRVHVSASQFSVAGGPDEPPLIDAAKVNVSLKLLPLLLSRGHDVQVALVELRDPEVNLVRREDGSWSLPQPSTKPKESGPSTELKISRFSLVNGTIRVIDRSSRQQGEAEGLKVALTQLQVTARGMRPGHRMSIVWKGAIASDRQNFRGSVSVDPFPGDLAQLTSDHSPKVSGEFDFRAVSVEEVRHWLLPPEWRRLFAGGVLTGTTRLATEKDGSRSVTSQTRVEQLSFRGSPVNASVEVQAKLAAGHPRLVSAQLSSLHVNGLGTELTGTASYDAARKHLQFAIRGPQLDVDSLIRSLRPPASSEERTHESLGENPSPKRRASAITADGSISVGHIRALKLQGNNLELPVTLRQGMLAILGGRVELYGGTAAFDHVSVNLASESPIWEIQAKVQGVDAAKVARDLSGKDNVAGTLAANVSLRGTGHDWGELRRHLDGEGSLSLTNGAIASTHIVPQIERPLLSALHSLHLAGSPPAQVAPKKVPQPSLSSTFHVKDGWAQMLAPVSIRTEFGSVSLAGRVGFNKQLDMEGDATISPGFLVTVISQGKMHVLPSIGLKAPFHLGGSLDAPQVTDIDWTKVVGSALLGGGLPGKALEAGKKAGKAVGEGIGDVLKHL